MPKTIRELADELKVSKQTIQYHYQRLPAKNRQKDSQGTNMISLTAERIIRDKVAKPLAAKNQQTGSKENNELIATLRREIEDLKSQRDKQLATKDRQIEYLTKLIDQQQQLQLAAVAENHQLEEHVQKLSGLLKSSSSTQKQQSSDKDDTLSNNTNDNHSKQNGNKVTKYGNGQKKACKSKANNSWWHFW
jgi:DNA-binding transcriptional MocR family regulator